MEERSLSTPRLIDSHAHLQAKAFDIDADEVLTAARAAGVERLMVPGWNLESSRRGIEHAVRFGVQTSAGVHPHEAAHGHDAWPAIEELAADPRVVAVGETGLDYDRGFSPRDEQLANLRRHLVLASATGKPAILHCRSKPGQRDAQDDLIRELAEAGGPPALLHSFSGPVDYAERALELGLWVSFSGLAFREGEEATATVARLVPIGRLLVETDSPYLAPPGAPRRRNTPEWVRVTAAWVAEQRGMTLDDLGSSLVANYDRLFGAAAP